MRGGLASAPIVFFFVCVCVLVASIEKRRALYCRGAAAAAVWAAMIWLRILPFNAR